MSLFESAIGLLAPPVCIACGAEGESLCGKCALAEIVPYGERCFNCGAVCLRARTCERCRPGAPRYVWLSTNYEGTAQELIKLYKFGHQRAAASSLAKIMVRTIQEYYPASSISSLNYIVVPIPTATSRVRQRSFDHTALLARRIGEMINARYLSAFRRIGQARQVGAVRFDRLRQLDGKITLRYPRLVGGRNILLVDDVVTTGATLRSATKELRAAGAARIDALVFAKRL